MSRRQRQNLAVFVDTAQHGMVTRSQVRSQMQKGKQQSANVQPLQSVQNLRQKGKNSVGGKRKTRAAAGKQVKNLGDESSSKRRVSRSLAQRQQNNENVPQQANISNSRAAPTDDITNKATHTLRRSSRRDSVMSMVDEAPTAWADDQSCPMSTVKTALPEPAPQMKAPCDIEHNHDDLYFVPYVEEIYSYLRERECLFRPSATYMDNQGDINSRMRSILINWLIEVHEKFRLRSSTLYLTVSIVDRFLSVAQVTRSKLQLVGCVAMLLASKFEEIYPPEVQDFVYIADSAYSREEILQMEGNVIRALGWEMSVVTSHSFANRFLQLAGASEWEQIYTYYLLELALIEYRMIKYKPSQLAAAAVHLTLKLSPQRTNLTADQRWGQFHETHTKYSRAMLKECMRELLDITMNRNPKEKAVRKKYAKPDRQAVSEISVRKLMRSSFGSSSSQANVEQQN